MIVEEYKDVILEKICRSCMNQYEEMRNVFESSTVQDGQTIHLADMLMACASISVVSNDGLPYLLCTTCETKLQASFEFRRLCEKSDNILREISPPVVAKQEEIIIKTDVFEEDDEDDDEPLAKYGTIKKKVKPLAKSKKTRKKRNTETKCKYCNKDLKSFKNLKVHLRLHQNDDDATKVKEHPCSECSELFKTKEEMIEHSKTVHPNLEPIVQIKNDQNSDTDSLNDAFGNDDFGNDDFEENNVEIIVIKKEKGEKSEKKKKEKKQKDRAIYECKECNRMMTTYVGLKVHMRRHTGNDLAECKVCNKSFTKKSHLARHMLTHGDYVPPIIIKRDKDREKLQTMECEFCDRKFKYRKSYVHHMQVEHGMPADCDIGDIKLKDEDGIQVLEHQSAESITENLDKPSDATDPNDTGDMMASFIIDDEMEIKNDQNKKGKPIKIHTCHVCQAIFARANHLTRHMTLHRAVLTHKCERCDKAFSGQEHLDKHVEEEHINKPYVCTVCNKPFSRGEHLIRHLKVHQSGTTENDGSLKCSICEHTFTRSDHLARHTKIHLLQDKRHVCFECGKAFNRLDNLKTHQRIHTGIKETAKLHLCIYCGKEFNNSSNMIVHMRRHTGERPYKCNECGKGFPRSHDLKCHERTHSGEKPYLCTLCGKSFNKSNKLLRHSRVHTGERPYVCNMCGRAFTQSNDLALHMRRHTGARPYTCGVCPARFIQSGQLKTHRRSTGHWMETQPDLKGGHRVEPVTTNVEPVPIKFKSHGKKKEPVDIDLIGIPPKIEQPTAPILGPDNPMIINAVNAVNSKIYQSSEMINLTTIQGPNGEEIKFKTELPTYTITEDFQNDKIIRIENSEAGTFQDNVTVVYSTVAGGNNPTFTQSETYHFSAFQP